MSKTTLQEAVDKIVDDKNFSELKTGSTRRTVVSSMISEQLKYNATIGQQGYNMNEADATTNQTSGMAQFTPILTAMVRRAGPQLIAHDILGVQPMQTNTGVIYALRRRYNDQKGPEALFNEPNSAHTGTGDSLGDSSGFSDDFAVGSGMITAAAEGLGGDGKEAWPEMGLTVEQMPVTAVSRKLKAQLTRELEQDMRSNHGLSAQNELVNLMADEIRAEIDREVIRKLNRSAVLGAQHCTVPGVFDLNKDADGRHLQERLRALVFFIDIEGNAVSRATRRGQANRIVASQNVVTALNMVGMLEYNPALANTLNADTSSTCYAGILLGKYAVYIDPYATIDYVNISYKGANSWDAGMYFCPYTPFELLTATDPATMNPVLGFTTRYAVAANPFNYQDATGKKAANGGFGRGENFYARSFRVNGIIG